MTENQNRVYPERLEFFTRKLLQAAGLCKNHAEIVTSSLIDANVSGKDSHGVTRLPTYLKRLERGLINRRPRISFKKKSDGTGIVDGDNGMGHIAAMKAAEKSAEIAEETGAAFIGVKNSNHFGTAGYYAKHILSNNKIGFVFSSAAPTMVPHGGATPVLGTNPLAAGIPTRGEFPIVIDMATSVVARGNILLADKEGKKIPEGWAVDTEGRPTTDAGKALEGAVLPFAGPKGYSLALLVDVLSGVLTGASWGKHINSQNTDFENPQDLGHFMGAIDIETFMTLDVFRERIQEFVREIKDIPPAPDQEEVMLPGEIEARTERKRRREGIPIPLSVAGELKDLGDKYDLDRNLLEVF